ncbi:MAG TPA: ATP-binding cassette domain-containing protein [candidate division Zixibacteria bacterium]|nr:ATP-binding cassette domain-containing protein [candidate division Zixibacteria bacterium]
MISLKNISKSFDGVKVLDDMNLDIEYGDTFVVMGKSGCGKSVTLKIILRLIFPDEGSIIIDGIDTTYFDEVAMMPVRQNIGMLFQGAALFDSMTVWQNLAYPLLEHSNLDDSEIDAKIAEMLSFVGLDGSQSKMPSELSGGMKKRVALARAMIDNPSYVFFDEPTTGLDPVTSGMINELIIRTRERFGVTSIVVTHDLASAMRIGTRFAFIDKGKIAFVGEKREMFESDNPGLREFLKDAEWQDRS